MDYEDIEITVDLELEDEPTKRMQMYVAEVQSRYEGLPPLQAYGLTEADAITQLMYRVVYCGNKYEHYDLSYIEVGRG